MKQDKKGRMRMKKIERVGETTEGEKEKRNRMKKEERGLKTK